MFQKGGSDEHAILSTFVEITGELCNQFKKMHIKKMSVTKMYDFSGE